MAPESPFLYHLYTPSEILKDLSLFQDFARLAKEDRYKGESNQDIARTLQKEVKDRRVLSTWYVIAYSDTAAIGFSSFSIPRKGKMNGIECDGTQAMLDTAYVTPSARRQHCYVEMTQVRLEKIIQEGCIRAYMLPAIDGHSEEALRRYHGFTTYGTPEDSVLVKELVPQQYI